MFHCERCFYETDRKDLLIKHLKKVKPCNVSNFNIERSELLNNLTKINTNSLNNKIYKCIYCNKEYINRSSKGMHQQKCKLNNETFSSDIIIKKKEELELKKIELELLRVNNQINNEKNNIINNESNIKIIKDEINLTNSNNNILNSNINTINNIVNNSNNNVINNNISNKYNIKNYLANNPNILPFTRYDVSLLYENNGHELKELIEYDKKYSTNNSDFINNFLKKLCFNEQIQSNLNMYYDTDLDKIIIKLANGITNKYKIDDVINDIMKQMKELLRKINEESYEINNINSVEYKYIDSKRLNYNLKSDKNYTFILELVKKNNDKIKEIPMIFNEENRNKKIIIQKNTDLSRPIDLRMDGPIDFNDESRFVDYEYRSKKFYRDTPNDTLYEFRTKKFIGQRKSYVNRLNGYDTDGEPLPDDKLIKIDN